MLLLLDTIHSIQLRSVAYFAILIKSSLNDKHR